MLAPRWTLLPGQRPGSCGRQRSRRYCTAVPVLHGCASTAPCTARLCQRGRPYHPYHTAVPARLPAAHLSLAQPSSHAALVQACRTQWRAAPWPRDRQGASSLLHLPQGPLLFRLFLSSFCSRAAVEGAALCPWSRGSRQRSALVSFRGSCLLPALRISGLHLGVAPLGLQFASNFNTISLAISVQDPRLKPAPGTAALICGQSSQRDLGRFWWVLFGWFF